MHRLHHAFGAPRHQRSWEAKEDVVRMCEKWYDYMQPGWCQPVRQEFMENKCEALPGVPYPGVRDNCSTVNTKTGYDDDATWMFCFVPSPKPTDRQRLSFFNVDLFIRLLPKLPTQYSENDGTLWKSKIQKCCWFWHHPHQTVETLDMLTCCLLTLLTFDSS